MIATDCHAHVYACAAAIDVLIAGGVRLLQASDQQGCAAILLCEPAGQNVFDQIREQNPKGGRSVADNAWAVLGTEETSSLICIGPRGERTVIVRGQQIVTLERLEVLAVGHDGHMQDGMPLQATIEHARDAGSHVILPWGAGKWFGDRGRLIDYAIERLAFPGLHLGDNGGRPSLWAVPQFSRATERKIKILCGSDPLPIARDERRIGTYASAFTGSVDEDTPWRSMAKILEDPSATPMTVGSTMNMWQFVRSQALLRTRMKRPK